MTNLPRKACFNEGCPINEANDKLGYQHGA
jgi:hypothetical protein